METDDAGKERSKQPTAANISSEQTAKGPPPRRRKQADSSATSKPALKQSNVTRAPQTLRKSHELLERRMKEQTAALEKANASLQVELAERKRIEDELRKGQAQLETRVDQRTTALANEITERRRVEEEIRARVRQQQLAVELGRAALAGMDLTLLMNQACTVVSQSFNVEYCKVLELLPDGDALLLRAGVGWKEGLVGHATVGSGTTSQAGYTLLSNRPVIVEDLRTENRFSGPRFLRDHGVVSGISVIIAGRNRPFGILGAHTTKQRTFSSDDVHFLETIANVLAEAIERKQAEDEIRRGTEWLRNLIDTTQDAVVSIDRQARIVLFNPAAERIFGYSVAEIVGRKVNVLMAEPYRSEHDEYIERYERTGEARALGRIRTVTAKRKNGDPFTIELSVTRIEEDENVQYAAFIRDISDKVTLQEQLLENERLAAIGTTAAKIGHELANPLNGMALTIQLLEQRLNKQASPADSQILSTVNRLKTEVSRLNLLLHDFRDLSRREKFDFRPTTLTGLVGEAIELEIASYGEKQIQVECSFPPDLPTIAVDIDKMKQVIMNLVRNAAEAMPGGGKISITGSANDNHVVLEITDTGLGVPSDINIFEPFFTTKPQGTGIGLTIVQQIVRAHGGTITYRSAHGKGTTFAVNLPRK